MVQMILHPRVLLSWSTKRQSKQKKYVNFYLVEILILSENFGKIKGSCFLFLVILLINQVHDCFY